MPIKGNRPNVSKLSAGLESGTLLTENASKFNLSLCVGKSRSVLSTSDGKEQHAGQTQQILTGILRHSDYVSSRMGTTLSLIFRRFATKFSNLVQKKFAGRGAEDKLHKQLLRQHIQG